MLKNNDSTLYQIMPIEIKLEETYLFKKGEEKGKILGEKRGEKRGEKKNRDRMILALYKKGKLNIEDIAEAAEVSVEYVKELVNNVEK
jgi:predicted transposase YdaD